MKGMGRNATLALMVVAAVVVAGVVARTYGKRGTKPAAVQTETVARRDIALTIEATGTVEPVDLIEVKSKASGQIVRMPVEVGSQVAAGQLLAQIDTRDVQNQYDQSLAAHRAAQAKAQISRAQKKRSDDLFAQQVITADEQETATLDYANAQAQLVKTRTDLDLARQRREDATVKAPISGTILEQLVSTGQVISSATSSASGGTSLLKMADLTRIRLRALVSETDIGSVRPGQVATVTVDAYPQRSFQGTVEKIEPQAVVQQSVTMFPVLIAIGNENGALLPGMNGEVSMLIDRRENVVAVPVDAVRSMRELPQAATALGLDPVAVRAEVTKMVEARAAERRAAGDTASRSGLGSRVASTGVSDTARSRRRADGRAWAGGDSTGRRGGRSGRPGDAAAGTTETSGGGTSAGSRAGATGGGGAAGGGNGAGVARASRAQVVFVETPKGPVPRLVRLGLSDFDYSEVVQGVEEGEKVMLLGVAEAQASRTQMQDRVRQRMGSGVVPGAGGGGGGTRGGGGR